MKYLSYKDIPIYADYFTDGGSCSPLSSLSSTSIQQERNDNLLMASEASVSIENALAPNRYIGSKTVSTDYSLIGPQTAKISMTFVPIIGTTDAGSFLFNTKRFFEKATGNGYVCNFTTTEGAYGTTLRLSNFVFKKSFLQNYSIKINPYQPITISANYISYDLTSVIDRKLVSYSDAIEYTYPKLSQSSPIYSVMHGITTLISNSGDATYLPSTNLNIEINVDCQRTPIFNIGSVIPESVIVTAIERTTTIQGENINNVAGLTGKIAAFDVKFAPLSAIQSMGSAAQMAPFVQHTINISGVITSQQLSVSQNSMLNGRVVIKEILL